MPNSAAVHAPLPDPVGLRYRLEVIALDVPDLVTAAGGWLYHRVAAGWDVTVALPGQQNLRPLQILGARTVDLETALSAPPGRWTAQCLAVVAAAGVTDARIRQRVQLALRHGLTQVVMWGECWPPARRLHPVHHVPTVAGRAFKRQALLAADVPLDTRLGGPELFHSDQKCGQAGDSDLVAVD